MYELIDILQSYHIAVVLIGLSVALVLVDYYFPIDAPAHFGYFCFGAGMFFVVPLGVPASLAVAVGVWLFLAVLHQIWFKRFLTNAPGTQRPTNDGAEVGEESKSVADSE